MCRSGLRPAWGSRTSPPRPAPSTSPWPRPTSASGGSRCGVRRRGMAGDRPRGGGAAVVLGRVDASHGAREPGLLALWIDSRAWGGRGAGGLRTPRLDLRGRSVSGFEGLAVVLVYELLHRPNLGAGAGGFAGRVVPLGPVAVLGLATVAIASPSARDHAHAHSQTGVAGTEHADGAAEEAAGLTPTTLGRRPPMPKLMTRASPS